jgi:uncharacterized protein YegL
MELLSQLIQSRTDEKKFNFLPFGVEGADMRSLALLAPQTTDERLQQKVRVWQMKDLTKFSQIFAFVSSSISSVLTQGGAPKVAQLDPSIAQTVTFDLST